MESTISHFRLTVVERGYQAQSTRARARRNARAQKNLAEAKVQLPAFDRNDREPLRLTLMVFIALALHGSAAFFALRGAREPMAQAEKVHVKVVTREPALPAAESSAEVVAESPRDPSPHRVQPVREKPRAKPTAPLAQVPTEEAVAPVPIVGLTLESTSTSGGGAAFAIGDTLSGVTANIAARPAEQPAMAPGAAPAKVMPHPFERARPKPGTRVDVAQRLSRVEPVYPVELERQRIEGDVTVRVMVRADGKVEHVEIVRGASDPAFDAAAREAARRESFSPEKHDGVPVATALTYTYRFRITP